MTTVRLQTSDGQEFSTDLQVAKLSLTIKNLLEDLGMDEDTVVPLPNLNSTYMIKVLEWMNHHKDDPELHDDDDNKEKLNEEIPSWDFEFLKANQEMLFELILAANYLDIKGLLEVTCKTAANMIKGKTGEEIRNTFNIANDFSLEEQEQIYKSNEWCEEKHSNKNIEACKEVD